MNKEQKSIIAIGFIPVSIGILSLFFLLPDTIISNVLMLLTAITLILIQTTLIKNIKIENKDANVSNSEKEKEE